MIPTISTGLLGCRKLGKVWCEATRLDHVPELGAFIWLSEEDILLEGGRDKPWLLCAQCNPSAELNTTYNISIRITNLLKTARGVLRRTCQLS